MCVLMLLAVVRVAAMGAGAALGKPGPPCAAARWCWGVLACDAATRRAQNSNACDRAWPRLEKRGLSWQLQPHTLATAGCPRTSRAHHSRWLGANDDALPAALWCPATATAWPGPSFRLRCRLTRCAKATSPHLASAHGSAQRPTRAPRRSRPGLGRGSLPGVRSRASVHGPHRPPRRCPEASRRQRSQIDDSGVGVGSRSSSSEPSARGWRHENAPAPVRGAHSSVGEALHRPDSRLAIV